MANGASCAERATTDLLIGPDWAVNIELCDIINADPGQAKDALKVLKKRLGSKNPKIQILALYVLETLSKNCGDSIHGQIIERDILHDMVKIAKKKPDLSVREKILGLIDSWQEAFGGSGGRYPQFHAAYQELRAAGLDFPPRSESAAPLFTPPQTHPVVPQSVDVTYDAAVQASLQSDVSALSLEEIQNARGIVDVLSEMLNALDQYNSEGVKQEVIVDLVEQCRSYQNRVMDLVSNTGDEGLLFQALALNDDLQKVLGRHDEIAKGPLMKNPVTVSSAPSFASSGAPVVPVSGLLNLNHEDDESEDEFSQLSRRSARENAVGRIRSSNIKTEDAYSSPLLPPPPPPSSKNTATSEQVYQSRVLPPPLSKKPSTSNAVPVDFLSGDVYVEERQPLAHSNPPILSSQPKYDEPVNTTKFDEPLPKAPWENQPASSLPPPPSRHNQRQQFFELQQQQLPTLSDSDAYNGLVTRTENLSLNQQKYTQRSDDQESSTQARQTKPEDALFKDLVDFARGKSSAPSRPPGSHRTR
ncbi:hypothetical protein HPP92_004460 [Vanilla planifolia]|uniref:TOM1-like protein 2 n=1 Tax=Vanilla planifolia TaxID=51239 RepID=A0A835S1S7_VANPL|nr:hypothetical protein HPP92_004460 [Vanilla planifolia]